MSLTLSGWAQPHDALRAIAPDAHHFTYAPFFTIEEVMDGLRPHAQTQIAIGWSLGGVLLMHAAAHGFIQPEMLVILSSPAQFVADATFPHGMGQETFQLFQENFHTNPQKTARRFNHLIADGDAEYHQVVSALNAQPDADYTPWAKWLDVLKHLRHDALPLHRLPRTLLIYGAQDSIVAAAQGQYLHEKIPRSQLILLPNCAHAPHLHDAARVQELIKCCA
jgi:pimeloyl-[acyl-carrier protein] methyl ester esterase